MSTKQKKNGAKSPLELLRNNSVPIMFILICAVCIPVSGFSPGYLINEILTRMGRNTFLILSLLIPIMAGMGLNFGMTLGAMAGQIGLIFAADWQIWGIPGMVLAVIISIPISVLLGLFCGKMLNMAKGREMITSYIIAFFMNGLYQLVVLYMMGPVIPIKHASIKLPRGYGIRNTVSLLNMRQALDNLWAIRIGGVKIPVLTLLITGLLCLFIIWFRKTKLGQDMRAVGQDMDVARDAGIKVERTRIIAIVLSTVCAGIGMVIYLQNMGNIATYSSHTQIGMFCIAALLVGGASVDKDERLGYGRHGQGHGKHQGIQHRFPAVQAEQKHQAADGYDGNGQMPGEPVQANLKRGLLFLCSVHEHGYLTDFRIHSRGCDHCHGTA